MLPVLQVASNDDQKIFKKCHLIEIFSAPKINPRQTLLDIRFTYSGEAPSRSAAASRRHLSQTNKSRSQHRKKNEKFVTIWSTASQDTNETKKNKHKNKSVNTSLGPEMLVGPCPSPEWQLRCRWILPRLLIKARSLLRRQGPTLLWYFAQVHQKCMSADHNRPEQIKNSAARPNRAKKGRNFGAILPFSSPL